MMFGLDSCSQMAFIWERSVNERLRCQLDTALRAGKRQAGPFAKSEPKLNSRKPRRKPGQTTAPRHTAHPRFDHG